MLLAGLVCLVAPLAANADLPGQHPYYLHALSDLRSAPGCSSTARPARW
jgi:hypothetical protein